MKTVREVFLQGKTRLQRLPGVNAALEARILLLKSAALSEQEFWASQDRPLPEAAESRYWLFVRKRLDRWPLAYLTGEKEFWSRPYLVFPGVFIPRPETELLVERVRALSAGKPEIIVEIGTGSGAIAVSLAKELPQARIIATDISLRALKAAALNAARHDALRVAFTQGDLFAPLKARSLEGRVHLLVSNPPYVSEADWRLCAPEIREHEPKRALVPGTTGLEFIRRLARGSGEFLRPGGRFVLEIGDKQAESVLSLLDRSWEDIRVSNDLNGIPRVVECRKPRS